MQLRITIAIVVYLASYLPLSIILLIQDINGKNTDGVRCGDWLYWSTSCKPLLQHPPLAIAAVVVCVACFIVGMLVLQLTKPKHEIKVEEVNHVPADLMNYVLPYVVSFMGLDYSDSSKFLGFFVFFCWIFIITHRSGRVILNPVLVVFGWRFYELSFKYVGGSQTVYKRVSLSRIDLEPGQTYRQASIQDVLIVTEV